MVQFLFPIKKNFFIFKKKNINTVFKSRNNKNIWLSLKVYNNNKF